MTNGRATRRTDERRDERTKRNAAHIAYFRPPTSGGPAFGVRADINNSPQNANNDQTYLGGQRGPVCAVPVWVGVGRCVPMWGSVSVRGAPLVLPYHYTSVGRACYSGTVWRTPARVAARYCNDSTHSRWRSPSVIRFARRSGDTESNLNTFPVDVWNGV